MKTARTLITICLLLTAATLIAQTTPSQRLMTVNVPFRVRRRRPFPAARRIHCLRRHARALNPHRQHRRRELGDRQHPAELCQLAFDR